MFPYTLKKKKKNTKDNIRKKVIYEMTKNR